MLCRNVLEVLRIVCNYSLGGSTMSYPISMQAGAGLPFSSLNAKRTNFTTLQQ